MMNNEATKERSFQLQMPEWKRIQIQPSLLCSFVVRSVMNNQAMKERSSAGQRAASLKFNLCSFVAWLFIIPLRLEQQRNQGTKPKILRVNEEFQTLFLCSFVVHN
jgi:hypothetical protein